jgi:MoaA/NifB/PqqE/SkfB family radical SAM enzyme
MARSVRPNGAVSGGLDTCISPSPPARDARTTRTQKARIDVCSLCELKCPACVQTRGALGFVGRGWMPAKQFRRLLDKHPDLSAVELSNWGEIFLNPELEDILKAAHERSVLIRASNGVHLNRASEAILESLVHHGMRAMTVSIDGSTPSTYAQYRCGGDLARVLENVRRIMAVRERTGSPYPILTWQFIVFGHNEHEIDDARAMAESLGMKFRLKLSSDELHSPVREESRLRTELGASSRTEWEELRHAPYFVPCRQLWEEPQINWDGRLLGCCINLWEDFGSVLDEGLEACLENPRYRAMRRLVMGGSVDYDDLPCHRCRVLAAMARTGHFVAG